MAAGWEAAVVGPRADQKILQIDPGKISGISWLRFWRPGWTLS